VGKVNPMNLKKSDKMIAIAGVVILIIAAIGIILYASNEPENEVPTNTEQRSLYLSVYRVMVLKSKL